MNKDTLREYLNNDSITIPDRAIGKLIEYTSLIRKANRAINLISPRETGNLLERHITDSLCPLMLGVIEDAGSLVDVGSGAGLPGIPLAIAASNLNVTMVESIGKKARFIERAIGQLELVNAKVVRVRVENFTPQNDFDYCVCRAFSSITATLRLFMPLVKNGGRIIYYKGPNVEKEIEEAEELRRKIKIPPPEVIKIPPNISPAGFKLIVYGKS